MQFIGIDPGGERAMGWCVLTTHATSVGFQSGCCTGIRSCFASIAQHLDEQPAAVGIDAPLYWTQHGDRLSDQRIRRAVLAAGGVNGTVAHVNSLRGACLVQGVLAAVEARKIWRSVPVTEAHPKALLRISVDAKEFIRERSFPSDHERDAALGAFAALAYYSKSSGWVDWFRRETDPFVPSGANVAYWFPECE